MTALAMTGMLPNIAPLRVLASFHYFRDLRRRAQAALGARFDIRRFHDTVIGSGGMPLEVLADHVDRFLRTPSGAAA